jgi:hypothetical protein
MLMVRLKILAICVLVGVFHPPTAPGEQNFPLLRNGDFTLQHGNRLHMRQGWLGGHTMKFEKAEGPDESPAVVMQGANGGIHQDLELVPGDYTLSVAVKLSSKAKAKIQVGDSFIEVEDASDWKRVCVKFVSGTTPVRITLDSPLPAAGTVRFRDVRVEVEKLTTGPVPVADGEPIGRIVLPPNPEPAEQYAAWELQHFIWRMIGVTPGLEGRDNVFTGRAIFVGRAAKGAEVDRLKQKPMKDESYVVAANGASLMLAGNTPRGTLYAAYDFLKTQGCGWYMPGTLGEVVPKQNSLVIQNGIRVESPDWEVRGILVHPSHCYPNGSWVNVIGDDYFDWAVRNRINAMWHGGIYTIDLGSHRGDSHTQRLNHSWHSFYPADGPAEWAPLVKGKRTRFHPSGRPNMVCTSNPDYRDAVVKGILRYFKGNPQSTVYAVSADDEPGFWCECEKCRALDPDYGKKEWQRAADGRPSLSMTDRAIDFVNEVAERVSRVYPDKQIEMYAYASTTEPPTRFKVHHNVLIKLTYFSESASRSLSDMTFWGAVRMSKRLNGWTNAGVKHFGLYDYGSFKNPDCPIFWFHNIVDSLKVFHEKWGFRHYLGETDNTFGPSLMAYNIRARALWDRNIDYRREIEDICRKFYGPAAEDMFEYNTLMDDTLLNWKANEGPPLPDGTPSLPGTERGYYWIGDALEYNLSIRPPERLAATRCLRGA